MSDFGLKISMPGADVKTASDTSLYFSSSFKTLNIISEGIISVKKGEPSRVVFEHNLGYFPCFVAFQTHRAQNFSSSYNHDRIIRYVGGTFGFSTVDYLYCDRKNLSLFCGTSSGNDFDLYYFLFDLNLEERIDPADNKGEGGGKPMKKIDYGFKISDKKNELSNSSYFNMVVHQVDFINTGIVSGESYKFYHNLDAYPTVFAYEVRRDSGQEYLRGEEFGINKGLYMTEKYIEYIPYKDVSDPGLDRQNPMYFVAFKNILENVE